MKKTYVALILDKSGSMASTKETAISGFNEQVQQLKEDAKKQEIYCSLVTFNGEVFEHLWNVPAEQLAEADHKDFKPSGATAMRDAVGYTIQKMLHTTDADNPENAYLFIIISDGATNQDRHYTIPALRELTESCQATNRWTFTYVGCSKQYLEEIAHQTATPLANMASWSNSTSRDTHKAFEGLRTRQKKYFAERAMGQTGTKNFTCDLNDQIADYSEDIAEVAPSPVLEAFPNLNVSNLKEVVDRGPKYTVKSAIAYNGEALFANSQKVEWQMEVRQTMPLNVSKK